MHLLPAEEQEQITEAGEEQAAAVEADLAPVPAPQDLPPAPSGHDELVYRLGQMEATMASLMAHMQAQAAVVAEQAQDLEMAHQASEAQEETLAQLEEEAEADDEPEPTLWEKCLGGHCHRKDRDQE